MPVIKNDVSLQTIITTFEVNPGSCEDLLEELTEAYDEVLQHSHGFIAAAIHVNDARTRIANYSQWETREDFQAMLRSDNMRKRNRIFSTLCKSFEPVLYDVVYSVD
jgi:quinol monooxygenase YgiN